MKGSNFTPKLKLLSIDIEGSMEMDLYSIAIYGKNLETVLMVETDHRDQTRAYQSFYNERERIFAFSALFMIMVRTYLLDGTLLVLIYSGFPANAQHW